MKATALALIVLSASVRGFSQSKDTIPQSTKVIGVVADKFAVARPLNIEFSSASPYNFSSKPSIPENKVNNYTQAKISANVNFIKRKTWLFGASAGYRYTHIERDYNEDYNYLFSSLNFTYFSTLFKKRTVYSSSLIVDGSDRHFERVKGMLTGVMVLKANRTVKMTVGLVVSIDPSAQTPVIPIFTYEQKFKNGLIADITLPKSVYLRKYVFDRRARISLGTELDRTSFYVYHIDSTSQRYEYRQLDINSGVVYEHAIGAFVITGKTGIRWTPSGRLFKKEDSYKDFVLEAKPDPTFYVNIGVSFNPFTMLKKK
jgi:hypothetical protein